MHDAAEVAGLSEALTEPDLTDEEARDLARRARDGDQDARDELILRHTRMATKLAGSYARSQRAGISPLLDPDELRAAAFEITIKAVDSYEPGPTPFRCYLALQLRGRLNTLVRSESRKLARETLYRLGGGRC